MKKNTTTIPIKICSHPEPRHLDDFLAIAYLSYIHNITSIEYLHPQNIPQSYLSSPQIALIDIGNSYNPNLNNFDHHHDLNTPCSFILTLKHFPSNIPENHPFITIIDHIDRFGFAHAKNLFSITPSEKIDTMRKIILLLDPIKHNKYIIQALTLSLNHSNSFNHFIENIYEFLNNLKLLETAKEIIKNEKKEFYEKIKFLKFFFLENLKIGYSPIQIRNTGKIFKMFHLDILILPGHFSTNETIIIKSNYSSKNINLNTLSNKFPVSFIHPNGFLSVIKLPINKINPNEIGLTLLTSSQTPSQSPSPQFAPSQSHQSQTKLKKP